MVGRHIQTDTQTITQPTLRETEKQRSKERNTRIHTERRKSERLTATLIRKMQSPRRRHRAAALKKSAPSAK